GVAVTGGFTIGGGNSIVSDLGTGPNYSLSQDFSVVKGTHQLGFGVTYIHTQSTLRSGVQANGTATATGQTTGLGLADYLVGAVAQWRQGNEAVYDYAQHYLGVYAQDNWKATPRLAVN